LSWLLIVSKLSFVNSELDEMDLDTTWMGVKQMQALLLREGTTECCPSVEELTTPKAGKDRFGNFVFLQSVDVSYFIKLSKLAPTQTYTRPGEGRQLA
jgi:hypothetical protein